MPKHMYELNEVIGFGNFLLSDERRELFVNHPGNDNIAPVDERIKAVTHADIQSFFGHIAPGS